MSRENLGQAAVTATDIKPKLEELRQFLQNGTARNGSVKALNGKAAAELPEIERISRELFRRASTDFLTRSSVGTLAQIAAESSHGLKRYLTENKPFIVEALNHPDSDERSHYTTFVTALADRPFIVDTVSEFMRVRGLRIHCLLHPIHEHEDGRRISLMYLEVDHIEDAAKVKIIVGQLESYLNELLAVTEDFPSVLARIESSARILESEAPLGTTTTKSPTESPVDDGLADSDRREAADFLRWLADGGFVFLGFREWRVGANSTSPVEVSRKSIIDTSDLGLFRSLNPELQQKLLDLNRDAAYLLNSPAVILNSKVLIESPVHRHVRMDLVTIKSLSADGKEKHIQTFLGLFTSKALSQEASSVPIIRQKLKKLIELEGALPNSHDYKHILSIVDSKPKFKLLRCDIAGLRADIQLIMSMSSRHDTRIGLHSDPLRRFFIMMVALPVEKFSQAIRQQIQHYIEARLGIPLDSSEYRLAVTDEPYMRINFLIPNPSLNPWPLDRTEVAHRIAELTVGWSDRLYTLLAETRGPAVATRLTQYYSEAFAEDYRVATLPSQALDDINCLEQLTVENPIEVSLIASVNQPGLYELRIFKRGAGLTLSQIVPLLENIDFEVATEYTNHLGSFDNPWAAIYELRVRPRDGAPLDLEHARKVLLPNLKLVLTGRVENDRLNSLLVSTPLGWREIALLRTMLRYIWQIGGVTSRALAQAALVTNPASTYALVEGFRIKFDPSLFPNDPVSRAQALAENTADFLHALRSVGLLAHDRVLRACRNVLDATERTNYFHSPNVTDIALKIYCPKVTQMPKPRPLYEIFVSAPDFEAVHLRSSKTARGGIRHSDRYEDFRTEVLGLMKTQVVKNSIIVPSGAKGGFVIRSVGPTIEPPPVKECYRRFIRCLLQITDNISDSGEVTHPPRVVIYDADDPYLVVAADKGTATFSDFANEIAEREFHFWLGDAFASGGSNGYDHKKLAITATGAWKTVMMRFFEAGIDPMRDEFTAIGIGDMSGDVFGNGLLRSTTIKLIGAFNHKHIFLDPNPDPQRAFEERKRLFALPGSSWTDYNAQLISPGGGVFLRSEKEIRLSPEAQRALDITEETLSGEDLIKAILKAPVDLLWNGGIGTYVKSSTEDNVSVGDRSNDDVRIDATELRAKVVGEGGNLGFTQLARIEFAQSGGSINTDAVDNSGGVDMSDHEVNLKILLRGPLQRGELSASDRNTLLASLAEHVTVDVLSHNHGQCAALSLETGRSRATLGSYQSFIKALSASGQLDRRGEFLPNDETFAERSKQKLGLSRPELAILLAHAKIAVTEAVLRSNMLDGDFAEGYLISYFPEPIRKRYSSDIKHHQLRREITATQIANSLVDFLGAVFVHRLSIETGAPERDVISAFIVASEMLGLQELVAKLYALEQPGKMELLAATFIDLSNSVEEIVSWLVERRTEQSDWAQVADQYRGTLRHIIDEPAALRSDSEIEKFRAAINFLVQEGFPIPLATSVTTVSQLPSYLDVATLSVRLKADIRELAQLRSWIAELLRVDELLRHARAIEPTDVWEESALRSVLFEVRNSLGAIVRSVVTESDIRPNADIKEPTVLYGIESYFIKRKDLCDQYIRSLNQLEGKGLSLASLVVLSNLLRQLSTLR